ncbi:hypothetical protein FEZ33_01270 [Ruoffia tabacinasalis]|uniref:Uncharacterized protein n=1 Tax=Ruoffia tabacinasalis TaxID=87458 RepID=A0A5R9EIW7_9LACT|nr:hypothetical protein [Ruoffia tabacinasalis]TLQ49291.1 hypothetical protein FEZ33_01270 [Ruoffia tabacinasalis]
MDKNKLLTIGQILIGLSIIIQIAYAIYLISNHLSQPSEPTHDPIYNQLIQGDQPMLVSQHKVGDDAVPEIHMEYYNPVSKTYYTVVYKE